MLNRPPSRSGAAAVVPIPQQDALAEVAHTAAGMRLPVCETLPVSDMHYQAYGWLAKKATQQEHRLSLAAPLPQKQLDLQTSMCQVCMA